MMTPKRKTLWAWIALVVLAAALAVPSVALAGGWAVVTLDHLPAQVIAGQPYTLGLMVRQHGVRALEADSILIKAWQSQSGQKLTFTAQADQQPGHYQVALLFPEPGQWEWGIQSGLFPEMQPMPSILVQGSAPPTTAASRDDPFGSFLSSDPLPRLLGMSALIFFAAGSVIVIRGREKRFPLLVGAGFLILCAGLAVASYTSANAKTADVLPASQTAAEEGASVGRRLFLAKGCVVCHVNDRAIKGSAEYSVRMGPDLSAYRNDPAFLHQFLKDPQSVRTASEMPDLALKLEEIDALVDFINNED